MHSDTANDFGPIFEGRYSDGTSAAAEDVTVRLADGGIAITRRGVSVPVVWPYGALSAAEPLNPHSIDALVTYAHAPGATLFVPEGTFARRLAEQAPQLTARSQRWRHARPWIWTAVGVLVVAALIRLSDFSPANAIAHMLPDKVRLRLGQQVIASMTQEKKVCLEPAGNAALTKLVTRLSLAAGHAKPFNVVVVDWGLLNAFATPGEQIVITRGLINKAGSPDEVAGVLAHEMGHGIEMHPETGMVRAIGLSAAMELMVGGGGGTIGNIGILLAQLSYTREAEHEADLQAVRILKKSEIRAQGLADFFRRMSEIEEKLGGGGKSNDLTQIWRTHPQTEERRRFVEGQPDYPATPALPDADWQALKKICGTSKPDQPQEL